MSYMENILKNDYTLTSILIINIDNLEYFIHETLAIIINSKNYDIDLDRSLIDKNFKEYITHCLTETLDSAIHYNIPNETYGNILISYLYNKYNTIITLDKEELKSLHNLIKDMVDVIVRQLNEISKHNNYTLITSKLEVIPKDRVYVISDIDLCNFKTISFKFYRGKEYGN